MSHFLFLILFHFAEVSYISFLEIKNAGKVTVFPYLSTYLFHPEI